MTPSCSMPSRAPSAWPRASRAITEVTLGDLHVGMTLADDVRAVPGHLLIARGYPVTLELIERLRNFPEGYVRASR